MNYWRWKMLYRIAERPYKRRRGHKNVSSSVTEKLDTRFSPNLAGWAALAILCSIPAMVIVNAIWSLVSGQWIAR